MEGSFSSKATPARLIAMFQRVTPTLQSFTYSRRVTSFMPLRTEMVSFFMPPFPSGTWRVISVSDSTWSANLASSGRPLMPLLK